MSFHHGLSRDSGEHRPPKASSGVEGAWDKPAVQVRKEEESGFKFWKPGAGSCISYVMHQSSEDHSNCILGIQETQKRLNVQGLCRQINH